MSFSWTPKLSRSSSVSNSRPSWAPIWSTGPMRPASCRHSARALRNSQNVDDYRVADFEPYYPAFGQPKAFVGTPVFDGPRMSAIMMLRLPIEPISNGPVGQSAMGGGRSGEDGRSLLARPRSDDADRFAFPDRGSGCVPRHIAAINANEPHGRHRRKARHDDPHRSRKHEAAAAALRGETGVTAAQRLPRCSGLDGVRARRSGLVAVGCHRKDRRGRSDGAAQ